MKTLAPKKTTLDLDTLHLASGAHASPDKGMCIMEAVAFLADESFSDHPACACPLISALMRRWNDRLDDDKQYIPLLVGSKSTREVERARKHMVIDWHIRVLHPHLLDGAELPDHAKVLRQLPEIVNQQTLKAAIPLVRAARKAAREASRENRTPAYLAYLAYRKRVRAALLGSAHDLFRRMLAAK